MENNSLAKLALEGCALAAPCRNKVAEKVIEYGVKAGISGVVANELAQNISTDELDHLITLLMVGNDEITNSYLNHLQDKYATTIAVDPNDIPKLEGKPIPEDNKGWTTTTPIPERDKNDGVMGTPISEQDKNAGVLPGSESNVGDWRDSIVTAEKPNTDASSNAGKDTAQNLPEWISDINSPNGRHYFNNINQKTTTKPLNTVIDSSVDVAADIAAIKNGQAIIKGNQISVNGRVYEREANGTLAPISGDGFTTLNRGEFKSLGVYNQFGNTKRAEDILNSMDMSIESRAKALEVWSKNNK